MRIRRALPALLTALALGIGAMAVSAPETAAAPTKGRTSTPPCAAATSAKANAGFSCEFVVVPKSKTKEIIAKIDAGATQEQAIAASGGTGGSCSTSGCYQWFTNVHAGYDAIGSYGWKYDSGAYQLIGTISIEIDDFLNQPYAAQTKPFCWSSTHSAPSVYMIAELYWATTGGSNGQLTNRRRTVSSTTTQLAGIKKCWSTTVTDNTRAIYTLYHYVSWRAAGFPGKWYAYNKGWIFYKPTMGAYLRYFSPVKYPVYANDARWQPTL